MPHSDGLRRAAGRRKSQFPAQTTVLAGASFDYFVSGTNFKITFDDLLPELGATGTIVQVGPVTAVPILDKQGTVNGIRNLTAGAGVDIQVDAENGITISVEANGSNNNQNIINVTSDALVKITDDILICSNVIDVTLLSASASLKQVTIKARVGANVTVIPDGSDTLEAGISPLTPGMSVTIAPTSTGEWLII